MSTMRSPVYAWSSGDRMHLWVRPDESEVASFDPESGGEVAYPNDRRGWGYPGFTGGIAMDQALFDALVLFCHAELMECPDEMAAAVQRAAREGGGNFGTMSYFSNQAATQ